MKILYSVTAPDKPECPVDGLGRHPDFIFWCPGCKSGHGVWTTPKNGEGAIWTFNGNTEKPTFTPSLLIQGYNEHTQKDYRCHSVITDGVIHFCGDCSHELAGRSVPMEAF